MDYFLIILATVALAVAVIEDLRRQKIPNFVTFPTMALAAAYSSSAYGLEGFLFSIGGLTLGIVFFIVPYIMGGMGAGDVKLMGAAGAIFGPKGIILASIMVFLIGGAYGLLLMLITPGYTSSFLRRQWSTLKTFMLTKQIILAPPSFDENRPVLKFAVPIALGSMGFMYMKVFGYDLFPELLGDKFMIFSILT
jgi:prepilin peptidase CpaA